MEECEIQQNNLISAISQPMLPPKNDELHLDDEFSSEAKQLMAKHVPMNPLRSSKSSINKLAIFMARRSMSFTEAELSTLNIKHYKSGSRAKLLGRAIDVMIIELLPDGNGGYRKMAFLIGFNKN